jgi:sugar lactone lactonase YvrE
MRLAPLCAGLLLLSLSAAAQTAREEFLREYELSTKAREAKDYAQCAAHSRRAAELAPRSVRGRYNLACAEALAGHETEAVRELERLAGMGVVVGAAANPDFDALRSSEAFRRALSHLAENETPIATSEVAFTLPEKGLITEGIAHDPRTGAFFVSSVRRRKIVRRDVDGSVRDFVRSGQDGLFSASALAVDAKRRALWVSSAAVPAMEGFRKEQENESFVLEYDLDSGRLRRKLLPPVAGGMLSDLSVGPDGELVVADPMTGRVYLLEKDRLRVVVEPGPIVSAQGLAFAPDGRLFVADYLQGPVRVDLKTGATRLLDAPADAAVTGIDGMVWAGGDLVGIQNGIEPHRVVRLHVEGDRVTRLTVVDRAHPRFDEPTLAVVVGESVYYVANSQYGAVREDGSLDEAHLREPTILRFRPRP